MWHKHYDIQRGNWTVHDPNHNYMCSFTYSFEAQQYCNKKNGEA